MSLAYEGWWASCDYCSKTVNLSTPGMDEEAAIEELIQLGWGNSDIDDWTGQFACPTCVNEHEAERERIERARDAGHILSDDGTVLDTPLPIEVGA